MSSRTLVTYEEPRNPEGPFWTLEVQRSASGLPTLLLTIKSKSIDGDREEETTIIVENADEVLAPAMDYLAQLRRQSNE
jgi:hypothetical protein